MAQAKIVLADTDENYLTHIIKPFAFNLGRHAGIYAITDRRYFDYFFATPQNVEILVVSQNLYSEELLKHNIGTIFMLTDEATPPDLGSNNCVKFIYKYAATREIFNSVLQQSDMQSLAVQQRVPTKLLTFYSPSGGLGQTTMAAGLCAVFAKNFQRALYINLDSLQTTGLVMQTPTQLQDGSEKPLLSKSDFAYDIIRPQIASESFDILPPFASSLPSLGVKPEHIMHLVELIKQSGNYDFIVLDAPTNFSEDLTRLMAQSDKTILVTAQDSLSAFKLKRLLDSIDCSDKSRFMLLCNRFLPDLTNNLKLEDITSRLPVEYVEFDSAALPGKGDGLAKIKGLQNLGQLLM